MYNTIQDIRFAFRRLLKSQSFTFTALLSLSVGIGANLIVFGLLNALLLTPLSVPDPSQLFSLQHQKSLNSSYPDYRDFRDRSTVFDGLALMRAVRVGFDTSSGVYPVWGYEVSGNYFQTVGVVPFLGRFIEPADEHVKGANAVAVLSYASWKERFGGEASVLGRTVRINKHPYTIVGVAPKTFHGTEHVYWPEVWLPVLNEEDIEGFNWIDSRGAENSWVIARLKTGVTRQRAESELNSIAGQLAREYPDSDVLPNYHLAKPGLKGDTMGGPIGGFFFGIMLLASLVLLAACMNLGGLFASRNADRAGELALRIALGSSRMRIFGQLLMEAILVSLFGCAIALVFAQVLLRAISHWHPLSEVPIQFVVQPELPVYLFGFAISVLVGLICASMSARQVWRTDPNLSMRKKPGNKVGALRVGLRDLLLGVQIMVCCLLVTASIVSLRGMQKALSTPLGFTTEGVYMASFDLHMSGYKDAEAPIVQKKLIDTISDLPGVTGVAYGNTAPLLIDQSNTTIVPETSAGFQAFNDKTTSTKFGSVYYQISPGYLSVTGMHLLVGRDFTWHDADKAPKVAIVSRSFAKALYGNGPAIGRRFFSQGQGTEPWEIVGIVDDGKYQTFGQEAIAVFFPILEEPSNSTVILAQSNLPASQVISQIKGAIQSVDASIPLFVLTSWSDSVRFMLFSSRIATTMLGVFGLIAMVLAITGIFGLTTQTVSKSLRDLGIRIALGARPAQIIRVVIFRTSILLAVGSVVGFFLGYEASKVIANIIYQASASDPGIVLTVVATMFMVGALATSLPLKRALSIRPMELLRSE